MDYAFLATLVLTMLLAGLLGGAVNYFLSQEDQPNLHYFLGRSLWIGIVAAFMVPLFLNMISSKLVTDIRSSDGPLSATNLLVFAGFCLIAAVSSRAFIRTLSDRVLKEVREAKKEAEQAKEQAQEASFIVEQRTEKDQPKESTAVSSSAALTEDEKKVLEAFQRRDFVLRTTSGIIQDSHIDPAKVENILLKLRERGLVDQRRGKAGGVRWYITQEGLESIPSGSK